MRVDSRLLHCINAVGLDEGTGIHPECDESAAVVCWITAEKLVGCTKTNRK